MKLTAIIPPAALALSVLFGGPHEARAQSDAGRLPGANGTTRPAGGSVSTCSARNALGTNQCTSTCPAGQTATCEDSDDGSDPTCQCTGG